ncbi:MAG TPA: protein kinase [Candidatus Solibacter sp.]
MSTSEETNGSFTLDQRLAEGPLPLPEALRYAAMLAEEVRQVHDSGSNCGALLPSSIAVTATGLDLHLTPHQPAAVTPYTAPEILQGNPADARSDIFAFGAIVYEMVTGRRAFAGDNSDALAVSLTISDPPPTGTAAVDHLVSNCIAKDPAVRCQRMQKVILELRLLSFSAPRTEATMPKQSLTAALRSETQQLENRVAGLLETHEKTIVEIQQTSDDAISELRDRLSKVESALGPMQARSAVVETLCQQIMAHLEQVQQNIEAIDERVNGVRDGIDVLSQGATVLHDYVGTRMHEFEQTLKSQRTTIASVAAGQTQTDDLVEGLVGAMDLLHTIVIGPADEFGSVMDGYGKNGDAKLGDIELLHAM